MRLKKLTRFRAAYFDADSRPTAAKLIKDIRADRLPGGYLDANGRAWVDVDVFEAAVRSGGGVLDVWYDAATLDAAFN